MGKTLYNKEILIGQLKEFVKINGKAPTYREMRKQGYAGVHAFINHFGSFKNALLESGTFELRSDKHQFCDKSYTDEELLEHLREYMKDKDRIPRHSVIKNELKFPFYPSMSMYERRFYSIFKALKLIGYDYEQQNEEDVENLKQQMLDKYRQLKDRLGHVPTSRDIENYSKNDSGYYSMGAYEFHFGSLHELQLASGFNSTALSRNKTPEELITDLQNLSIELGRTPIQIDMDSRNDMAGTGKYRLTFGSWNEALLSAGLDINDKVYYSSNGTKCLSYYELLFTNMLEEYNISFTKENYYSEFMETDRKFRFDFVLVVENEQYFIEIFGIESNESYSERTKLKKELCSINNINLIEIYPDDFKAHSTDDIHKILNEKINKILNK